MRLKVSGREFVLLFQYERKLEALVRGLSGLRLCDTTLGPWQFFVPGGSSAEMVVIISPSCLDVLLRDTFFGQSLAILILFSLDCLPRENRDRAPGG